MRSPVSSVVVVLLAAALLTAAVPAAAQPVPCTAPVTLTQGFVAGSTFAVPVGDTANTAPAGTPQELGQSFTAPCDGVLDALQFVAQATSEATAGQTVAGTVILYAGSGTGGPVLASGPFRAVLPPPGEGFLVLPSLPPLALAQGQVVTAFVDVTSGPAFFLFGVSPGTFDGGDAYASTTGGPAGARLFAGLDVRFSAFISPGGGVAGEDAPGGARIGPVAPNPAAGAARLSLRLDAPQAVRAVVADALGRTVAVLHDGPLAAGVDVALRVDTARLAPGTYVVRVVGETFAATRRLTVAR